ncbi:MAG: hypothetical protein LBK99_21040, partial [Opitutaceae bacterium]|nr:hypothetical protein [Opitutaceae bacterium]
MNRPAQCVFFRNTGPFAGTFKRFPGRETGENGSIRTDIRRACIGKFGGKAGMEWQPPAFVVFRVFLPDDED